MMGRRSAVKLLALACTAGILAAIYAHIDLSQLLHRLLDAHPGYFALALFLFIPQILVTSVRWRVMMARIRPLDLGESIRMVMAGKALNALVPSKLGEMSKAYFLKMGAQVDMAQSVSAVILEKILDMGGLCTMLLMGIILTPESSEAVWLGGAISAGVLVSMTLLFLLPLGALGQLLSRGGKLAGRVGQLLTGWQAVLAGWKGRGGALPWILVLSVLLWGLHVLQIYLFFPSLRHPVPLAPALAYIPLGIVAGLLPITIGGMGTRDSALILLFSTYADPAVMAGIGLLCSLRYWMDTLLGVPFFHWYTSKMSGGTRLGA